MLAPPPPPPAPVRRREASRRILAPREPVARWCDRCGAPRNLGRHDCPGCRLLDESRERIANYLARHGMPEGGALELARKADVPLRAVGELMTRRSRPKPRPPRGMQYYSRTVRTARKLVADGPASGGP